ncbi:MAG: DUF1524 domain-containing protein [Frankiales bacterium]|nr:DUF1524 domain-containing protein [Frankiales bacterium]
MSGTGPPPDGSRRARAAVPWWQSWPAVVAGLVLCVVPGLVLLWLRPGSARVKAALTAATVGGVAILGAASAAVPPSAPSGGPPAALAPASVGSTPAGSTAPAASASPTAATAPATSAPAAAPSTSARPSTPPAAGTALALAETLRVKGRAPMTGYSRAMFGPAWADVDGNGCDTRNDVLRRDLTGLTMRDACVVLRGTLRDPYDGSTIAFVRGVGTSSRVQIDHVVALGDAWQKGAQSWSAAKREALANDPLDLLAVDGPNNERKGDGDAATWLPPARSFRCAYVARQTAVKAKYGLWVTAAEKAAILRVLGACPDMRALPPGPLVLPSDVPATAPTTSAPAAGSPGGAGLDPRFATCAAAKAAGYGPYVRGRDPEYAWYRDADGDGVDCE